MSIDQVRDNFVIRVISDDRNDLIEVGIYNDSADHIIRKQIRSIPEKEGFHADIFGHYIRVTWSNDSGYTFHANWEDSFTTWDRDVVLMAMYSYGCE